MELSYDKMMKEMADGKFRPAYLLHGEEPYFIDSACKYLEENALTENEKVFNSHILYGRDVSMDQVLGQARMFPMSGKRQLIIVKEAQAMRSMDAVMAYLERPVAHTVLVIAHKVKSLNKTSKVYKQFKDKGAVLSSSPMKDYQLRKWLPGFLTQEHQIQIEPMALELLMEFQGTEIAKLVNELQKVRLRNPGKAITTAMVQENIGFGKDFDVFEVQDALAARDKAKLVRMISYFETFMKPGDIIALISILYKYFAQAYVASVSKKTRDLLFAELGITEWGFKKLKVGIDQYGYKLAEALQIIKDYELRSKGINSQNVLPSELLKEMLFKVVTL